MMVALLTALAGMAAPVRVHRRAPRCGPTAETSRRACDAGKWSREARVSAAPRRNARSNPNARTRESRSEFAKSYRPRWRSASQTRNMTSTIACGRFGELSATWSSRNVELAPRGEFRDGPSVGPACVRVADVGGEELNEALAGLRVGREQGRHCGLPVLFLAWSRCYRECDDPYWRS
jgi:hypothetical protein